VALLASDPVDWALDPLTGDLIMPIRFVRGREAVAQGIKFRLQLVRGEVFADLDIGVPYLEGNGVDPSLVILGRRFDRVRAESAFRAAILRTPGVRAIRSLSIEFDGPTRELRAAISVETQFDDTLDLTFEATP
jgi:hypothetical protein